MKGAGVGQKSVPGFYATSLFDVPYIRVTIEGGKASGQRELSGHAPYHTCQSPLLSVTDEFDELSRSLAQDQAARGIEVQRARSASEKSMSKKVSPIVDRSEIMRRVRSRDTSPELFVRSALHRRGLRFRLHRRDLPGRPDIVLPGLRVVVFVHGCFWHGHDCPRGRPPASNREFWLPKLEANRRRDDAAEKALRLAGWRVETVWQCSLKASTKELVERLAAMRAVLSEAAVPSDRSSAVAAQSMSDEETNL